MAIFEFSKIFFIKSWVHGHSIFSWNFTSIDPPSGQPERFFEKKLKKKIWGENFKNAPIRPQGPPGPNYYTIRYHYLVPPHTTPFDQIPRFEHCMIWYTFLPNRLLNITFWKQKKYQYFIVVYAFIATINCISNATIMPPQNVRLSMKCWMDIAHIVTPRI